MSDHGYTLLEMLLALAMIGLAVSGLSWGFQVLSRWERATNNLAADLQANRRVQTVVQRVVAANGPFRSDHPADFTGDAKGYRFACGMAAPCSVQLLDDGPELGLAVSLGAPPERVMRLGRTGPAHFSYRGSQSLSDSWPPPADGALQVLRTISLTTTASADPVLVTRVWAEQPANCVFDVILQDCR